MAGLKPKDKILVDKLVAEGKICKEIREQLNVYSYTNIWNYINREAISRKEKEKRTKKVKPNTLSTKKYVPTGFPMPPINPPKPMTVIIDKELAEVACREMGLKPPVTTLVNRPATFSRNMQWDGKKWVVVAELWNEGMVNFTPKLRSNV